MPINMFGGSNSSNQEVVNPLDLKKKAVLDLTKAVPGLKNLVLGAGWDIAKNGASMDLDIAAFLLGENGRVSNISTDVVFFNNMRVPGLLLEGDNRTGYGEGDDERIQINLDLVPERIKRIVFVVTIHEAAKKRQTFGMVDNSYVRLLNSDENDEEICKFNLKENASTATSIIFAELYKENNNWNFMAVGEGKIGDLNDILSLYM